MFVFATKFIKIVTLHQLTLNSIIIHKKISLAFNMT